MKLIYDPIFLMNIFFIDAKDVDGFKKEYKKIVGEESDLKDVIAGRFEGHWNDDLGLERCIIWAPSRSPEVLVHEISHATLWILNERRGIPHNDHTDELYCYYSQFILKECLSDVYDKRRIRVGLNGHHKDTPKKKTPKKSK